ncbi:MAG TPA: LuxR C-terminal-related transcriptional regulator [Actinotalea sp.]|nr:LuxR C-terminal-related transcriptional regulator [Actinotalea sp.]
MPPRRVDDPLSLPLPRHAVSRPELERHLDRVGPGGLGLVVASAGSGKSILLRQWAAGRPGIRVVGLGLDASHDDAAVLARRLVEAVRRGAPDLDASIVDLAAGGGSTLGAPFVDALLDELENVPEELVLVLEDLHALSNRPVVMDLGDLVTRLPNTVRCVVSTRRDPPWTLRRLRLDGRLVELRGTDLAFRQDEAELLLTAVSERELSDHDVQVLTARTDGWAVGLQLAGISLRHQGDVSAAITSFAGSDRLIAEYLLEEVLDQLEPDIRTFLLQTSVLDWLSVDLCDAVTGAGNARRMLAALEDRSLFVIPLDLSRTNVRYHHLFAELLRYQLRAEDPSTARTLHRRAARWLLEHGRAEESIDHLLRAGEHDQAFTEISRLGHRFFERGESATLVRWLTIIQGASSSPPSGVVISLLAAEIAADLPAAAAETHRQLVRRPDLTPGERATADALHTTQVFRSLSPDTVIATAHSVLDVLPSLAERDVVDFLGMGGTESVRLMAEYDAAIAHFLQGDLEQATARLRLALDLPGAQYPIWRFYTLGSLALVRAWTGHCTEALQLADAALSGARALDVTHHPAVIHAHLAAALAHLYRADFERAAESLDMADLLNLRRPSNVVNLDLHRALAAHLAAATGDSERALLTLRRSAASALEAPVLAHANRALHAQLLIDAGEHLEARALLDDPGHSVELGAARVDLGFATGGLDAAMTALRASTPPESDVRAVIGHRLREAAVLDARGERVAAQEAIRLAVAAAEGDQLRWPFLEVTAAEPMLRQYLRGGAGFSDDLRQVLERASAVASARARRSAPGTVDALTERELAVLAYLPRRIKHREIAAELYITMNTLKTHLSSIYRKLGVTDRDEAATRAVERGLL